MKPKRLTRYRKAGWKKPDNSVIVDRTSRWGNPYVVTINEVVDLDDQRNVPVWRDPAGNGAQGCPTELLPSTLRNKERALASELFASYARHRLTTEPDWLTPLRGRDLVCFCPEDAPCHADVLLELANS